MQIAALIAARLIPWEPNGASRIEAMPVLEISGEAGTW